MKQIRLIKMCQTETYGRVRAGKNLSEIFPNRITWKKEMIYRHCFHALPYNIAIGEVQVNQDSLKLNGTCQLVVYVDGVNI
jgi:hypothetical protein